MNRYLETRWTAQTLDSIRAFVDACNRDPLTHLFAIIDLTDGAHVGNCKLGPVNSVHSHADISYFIGERSRWGQGLAQRAVGALVNHGFQDLGVHRLQAGVYESNIASCRLLERLGFTLEGRFRAQLRGPDGWEDHVWYGKLNPRQAS